MRHSVDGNPTSLPKRGQSPQFSVHLYCGQTAGCINMPLGMEVGLSPGDFVLDGDPVPLPQKGQSLTQFSAYVYCGQTAVWIKMPLGTEVGLGLRDIVFDVDPDTPRKRAHPPHPMFGPYLLVDMGHRPRPNDWTDEDAAWYGSRPRLRPHCTRRGPSSRERGTAPPFLADVYCGHGRPSQLLLSSCLQSYRQK